MAVIREIVVDEVGQVLQLFDLTPGGCRGFELIVATNPTDEIILKAGAPGWLMNVLDCQPIASSSAGVALHVGGSIAGPQVSLDWQGTSNLKQGILRLHDAPIRPFGRMRLGTRVATALGAGATSAFASFNAWGSWVKDTTIYLSGTDSADLIVTPDFGTGISVPFTLSGALPASGSVTSAPLSPAPHSVEVQVKNTSAGAANFQVTLYASG